MQVRSNISSSLAKKRQASLRKKVFAYSIFVLFFLSLIIWGLTTNKVQISNIKISGNSTIATGDILKIVNDELNKYYLFIIPTRNVFLLRRESIENGILSTFKKIFSVEILIHGINSIEITVKERQAKGLWCKEGKKQCYFLDAQGYIFEESPTFSEDTFPEYFGLIEENPVGQYYFKNNFKNISGLFDTLKKLSFWPKYFYALDEHEYEIYILGGGKIFMNDKKSFESSLTNLQAMVDNNYIKNDMESIKKIKYIDLRFGNKVNFELNK